MCHESELGVHMKNPVFVNKLDTTIQHVNTMSAYFKEIDRVPLLSRQEEEQLTSIYGTCCQIQRKKNPKHPLCPSCSHAKNKLITANLRFVVSVAKKYQNNNISLGDLINEGNLGLLTAVDKFDHTLGYHFISYAVWWIKQSILKAISEKSRMIRLPMNRTNELFKIIKFMNEYAKEFHKKPTDYEIETQLGIPRKDIAKILTLTSGYSSLEELSSHENIEKPLLSDIQSNPEQGAIYNSLHYGILQLLEELPEREKFILIHRFGLDGNEALSLSKIGSLLGLTKERVRQLQKEALKSIKELATDKEMLLYFF